MQSEAINDLAAALTKAQAAMQNAAFNRINPRFGRGYADLSAVIEAVRPALNANGLSVTQETRVANGAFVLATMLRHTSGQWIEATYPLPANGNPQEIGSALTYARRYSLSAICGIASEDDDDANAAEDAAKKRPPATVRTAPTVSAAPHQIDAPPTADGRALDWRAWGTLFVNAINAAPDAGTFQAWVDANADPLNFVKTADAKVAAALQERIATAKSKFTTKEAA